MKTMKITARTCLAIIMVPVTMDYLIIVVIASVAGLAKTVTSVRYINFEKLKLNYCRQVKLSFQETKHNLIVN